MPTASIVIARHFDQSQHSTHRCARTWIESVTKSTH